MLILLIDNSVNGLFGLEGYIVAPTSKVALVPERELLILR